MNKKKKYILDIVGKAIEKYGFVYDFEKAYTGSGIWGFVREVNSIKQRISIQKNRFTKSLFLNFETSAWGQGHYKRAGSDSEIKLPKGKYSDKFNQWYYETDEDFKKILVEFADIIEKYGITKLTEMSIEPTIIPTVEMAEKLLLHHINLNEQFIKDNELDTSEISKENVYKWFKVIEKKFKDTKYEPYENVQDMLIEVTAFLGEQLKIEMEGNWKQWGQDIRFISILQLNSEIRFGYSVLAEVVKAWDDHDFDYFREYYLLLLDSKLPVSEEKRVELKNRENQLLGINKIKMSIETETALRCALVDIKTSPTLEEAERRIKAICPQEIIDSVEEALSMISNINKHIER